MCTTARLLTVLLAATAWLTGWGAETDTTAVDQAQSLLHPIRRTIRGFDRLNKSYIEPQHYEYTIMLQTTRNYESFILGSRTQSIMFAPDQRVKVGPYLGWRWFFLGYTFDLTHIGIDQGKLKREFDLSVYSSQIGVDLFYRRTGNDYKVRDADLDNPSAMDALEGLPFDGLKVGVTGLNLYYIFNHGRFSYPAAFSQSTCQKVSCGSWMAGVGYTKNTLDLDYQKLKALVEENASEVVLDSGMMFNSIRYTDYSLSGGYAYNWVFAKNWLFCASLQGALAYKTSYGVMEGESPNFDFRKVNLDGIGRFGLIYNNMRWYTGFSVIMRTNNYHTSRYTANNIFGSMNAYIGYNFGLKKKYRQKK